MDMNALAQVDQPERLTDAPVGRAHHILARSLYRELRGNGYTPAQILALSAEMVSLVTSDYGVVDEGKSAS
jgi:hypothetical protein